jgi:MoaA/NifB/PqqE/SkfB family radical SAM enzyme
LLKIIENSKSKCCRSNIYNYNFDKQTGYFQRWGATQEDDPQVAPFPELLDIEISSASPEDVNREVEGTFVTDGGCSGRCQFCYKNSKSSKTRHMSLELLGKILDRFYIANNIYSPTQVAYGITDIYSHPQLFDILEETRRRNIIPNLTTTGNGLTEEIAERLSKLCGAIAVSVNSHNKEIAYDAIKKLSQDNGMSQINIHIVLAEETIDFIKSVVFDMTNDPRLSKMNALVMLSFKDKAKTGFYNPITFPSYLKLIEELDRTKVKYGFDSCSAGMYNRYIANSNKSEEEKKELSQYAEKCEMTLFSGYISVFGEMFPCSFCEGLSGCEEGVNILEYNNISEIWSCQKVNRWRQTILDNERNCPFYKIGV